MIPGNCSCCTTETLWMVLLVTFDVAGVKFNVVGVAEQVE
ncbi:hypothetical protein SOVF_069970 [Spinacia oleracea]|nr:hypothetical protein SOVF_069970 [Spinacia oleracea]